MDLPGADSADVGETPEPDAPEQAGMLMTVAVLVISVFGFLGKVAGYVKEIYIAKYWGASATVDTFKVIYNSVIFLVYSKVEKLLRPTYLPIFVKHRDQNREDEAKRFFSTTATMVFIVLVVITGVVMVFAPQIMRLGWAGITGQYRELAVDLLRLAAGAMLLLVMSVMAELTLHAYKRFTAPALADACRQLALLASIGGLVGYGFFSSSHPSGIKAAAIGVLIGAALRLIVQLPALYRKLGLVKPSLDLSNPDVRRMLALMPPVVVGLLFSTARTYFDSRFGTDAGEGVYAALDYARKISDMPVMIIPLAVSLVVYPWVSEWATRMDREKLAESLVSMTRVMAFIFVPLAVGLIVLSTPAIQFVYERGQFVHEDTLMVRRALVPYAAGIPFLAVEASINKWYFALGDTATPNYVGASMAILHILIAYFGVYYMRRAVGVLAFAFTASKALKVVVLYGMLRGRIGAINRREVLAFAGKLAASTAVMAVAVVAVSAAFADMLVGAGTMSRLIFLALCGASGVAAFLTAAAVLRIEELTMVVGFVRTKLAGKLRRR